MRHVVIVFSALLFAACGSDPTYFPFGTDAIPTDTGTGDAPQLDTEPTACEEHADCAGGEVCTDGVCVPVSTTVCEPGEARCEANVVVACNADGSAVSRIDCGTDECVEGDAGASCVSSSCEDGQVGCIDGRTRYICTDGERTLVGCGESEGCIAGECVEQVCEPNSRRCEEETVIVCDAAGVSESTIRCELIPECEEAAGGCACQSGECVPRECTPNAQTCDGDNVVRCAADGSGYSTIETCDGATQCVAGECVAQECEDGNQCVGDTLVVCNDGVSDSFDCQAEESYCSEDGGAHCEAWVCEPGSGGCAADGNTRLVCNLRGSDFTESRCPAGEYCSGGICLDQICDPGERVCDGGNAYRCADNGSSYNLAQTCAFDEECVDGTCIGEGECASSADCPAPAGRCDGTTLVTYDGRGVCRSGVCNYDSVTNETDCAASEEVCDASSLSCVDGGGGVACVPLLAPCPEGEYCVSGFCRECATASDCSEGFTCIAGECEACDCPPGLTCTAGGGCADVDPSECSSDSECRDIAEALGVDPDNVACDSEVGCFERGICGGTLDSPCPAGTTCGTVIDLLGGGTIFQACTDCTVGDDSTCRSGEYCQDGFSGFTPSYCAGGSSGGGGFPFP